MSINSSIHPGRAFMAILVCLPLLASACATPISVKRVDARQVHRELTRDVLSAERPKSRCAFEAKTGEHDEEGQRIALNDQTPRRTP